MTDPYYLVAMPSSHFTTSRTNKPIANGKIYIGKPDTDPKSPENRIPIYVVNEDGREVEINQPISINSAGYPVYNGQVMKFITKERYSTAIYNAYDALEYYWHDLAIVDPVYSQDAATKKYVDISLERTLRVPEKFVKPLPSEEFRAGMILAFSYEGQPIMIASQTDTADLAIKLGSENGWQYIGSFFPGEGKEQAGYLGESLRERLLRRGQFGAIQSPGDQPYLAGMVFGDGKGNLGGVTVDARGRASTHAASGGHITATGIGLPFCELTGHYNGQFPNVTMKAHSPLAGDDNLMPGLMWVWDGDERKERLLVTSPFNPGNDGYPIDGYNEHVNLLASYYDIGYGLNHSFDHFNTTDIAQRQWGKICTIRPGTSGGSVKKFSALITAGSYVNYEQGTFLLDVNGQNLIDTITSGNMNRGSIGQWIKFIRLSDSTNIPATMNYIPEVGVIVNTSTGNAEVWLKLPYYSPRVSITVLSLANPTYVQVDWSDWKGNSLRTTEPGGITYAMTSYPVNSQNYVKTNSGQVVYAPNKVLRIKDVMSASSTYNRMSEFLEYGFSLYGTNFAVNRYMGDGISVTKNSTGTYSVSGCTLSGTAWKVKPPVSWVNGSAAGIINITSSSSGSFAFTLKDSAGNLIDIPDGTWVDFHVS